MFYPLVMFAEMFFLIYVDTAAAGDCALLKGTLQYVEQGKSDTVCISHLWATPSTFNMNARLQQGRETTHEFNSCE